MPRTRSPRSSGRASLRAGRSARHCSTSANVDRSCGRDSLLSNEVYEVGDTWAEIREGHRGPVARAI
jgi:hypothetical protein